MSDVPDEILREILSRLPVAPLLRFRCVSKSWKDLIDSRQFIKHHLNHSRKTNSNLNIILDTRDLYSADFDLLNETNMATFKELSHPLKTPSSRTKILGSCDGLLVLRNDKYNDTILLWNPSVRRFHEIPLSGIEFLGSSASWKHCFYGFGYDVVSDDYKLVRIDLYAKVKDGFKSKVNVYSLKSGSWRKIPDFANIIRSLKNVFVNGALHWIVGQEGEWNTDIDSLVAGFSDSLVAAFDLGTEEYRLVPLPKLASNDFYLIVGVLGGCLSVMYGNKNEGHVEVWVMKEYGVQESWSILFAFDIHIWDFDYSKLIAYSKCGRKVLLWVDEVELNKIMWYDLDKKSTESPMLQRPLGETDEVCICLQSLVLFNNGTCDFDLFTKRIQEKGDRNE